MEKDAASEETVAAAFSLAELCLRFARTMRVIHRPDGKEFESDTDHTVMLGIMAPAFAARFAPHLDQGKIAQFALVHDLAEAYAGDTGTFRIMSEGDAEEKAKREEAAIARIRLEFDGSFPWIGETLAAYERLDTPEARFVKVFDKALPKFLHVLNDGATARGLGHSKETTEAFCRDQIEKIRASYGSDQPEAVALLEALVGPMSKVDFTGSGKGD